MVKTRHSGDIDVESPTTFLSLTTEKNRLSSRSGDTGENTHSRAYDEDRNAFNIFEEKVVESRLRPRTGPSRAYNYLDADSSDEDSIRRRRHHIPVQDYSSERRTNYTRSRQVKQEMINAHDDNISKRTSRRRISYQDEDHSEEEEDEDNNSSGITHWDQSAESRARNSGRLRQRLSAGKATDQPTNVGQQYSEDDDDANVNENKCKRKYIKQQVSDDEEDDVNENKRKRKYTKQQVSYDEEDDAHVNETKRKRKYTKRQQVLDDEEAENLRRRSSRTRRQVYDTLNQSYLVSIPGRSKLESDEANDNSDNKEDSEDNQEFSDMYSRVKRKRVQVKRNMYGVPINDDSDSDPDIVKRNKSNNKDDDTDENCEEEEDTEKDDGNNNSNSRPQRDAMKKKKQPLIVKSYSLREHKPRTDLYKAPIKEPRIKRIHNSIFASTPTKKSANQTYHSPAQRRNIRKRSAFHSSSSSTSSSESESSDEKSFKRRKAKSMAKARSRMMPMNFSTNAQPSSSVIKDRVKSGASLADVEPMTIDRNVTFNSIGGLGKHIRALKEMVVFPLLYDKVFERFNVDPPRGVLFYGPPGTGKTLVARALANECSQGDRRVAFFMRKGADCLSKWVGESERQLRLLFDQAYKYRPSIIFFDEIDGLAPVRSSRQDQIHSSIVSTLLALMDGLDSRGEIVVIGATNRIDSLDPALRRPGRFDREFLFPLPTLEARKQILTIHTSSWRPKLNEFFISELAERCVGYCGADIKALCTEAAMLALRRRYPQIYMTNEALELDVSSINISAKDFFDAINNIIPTSQRSVNTPARALSSRVAPLLQHQLNQVLNQLADCFPPCLSQLSSLDAAATVDQAQVLTESGLLLEDLASDEDEEAPSIFTTSHKIHTSNFEAGPSTSAVPHYLNFTSYATSRPATFRPRLMLVGREGQGQTTYIAPAVLHRLESLPVHVLDLPTLYAVTAKTPEESCANVFHEAKRKCPSIIYIPYVDQWWGVMAETLRATLLTLIQDLNPSLPLLLLATSEQPYYTLDTVLQSLFCEASGEVVEMRDANLEERRAFFQDLLLKQTARPPPKKKQAAQRMLEVLPKAAPPKARELTKEEVNLLMEKEELTLMELRIFLRDVLNKLGSDKKFSIFAKPVNIDDAPDYYEIIEHPMDLSTMMGKIDLHEYGTVRSFMNDIDLICSNALEYNPNRGPMDRVIRHRACALKDTAYAIIKTELDKDFEKTCVEIEESRKRRGQKSTTVPNFYYTKPNSQLPKSQAVIPDYLEHPKQSRSIPKPEGERYSRRVRGLNIDPVPPLEAVEKVFKLSRATSSPPREDNGNDCDGGSQGRSDERTHAVTSPVDQPSDRTKANAVSSPADKDGSIPKKSPHLTSANKSKKNKCVWCKPRRKRRKLTILKAQSRQASGEEDNEEEMSCEEIDEECKPNSPKQTDIELLKIDTALQETDIKDLKSPGRCSSRLKHAPISPRVVTRRSSMSPTAEASHTLSKQLVQTSGEQTTLAKSIEETAAGSTGSAAPMKATEGPEKCSVVKRLDLDVVTDSGIGSSLDSNGDSRDSIEHPKVEGENCKMSTSVTVADANQNCNSSRASNQVEKKVEIDLCRLTSLLNELVAKTDGYNVERLEKLYSSLSLIIYRHRGSYDRSLMIVDLEQKVEQLTTV
ncbi:ATPase family AAA domain-containing protein 2-like isoform X4 [Physella acuta]|uniref:ATPase family AAA domain-containing protein 2-like isoform X4 n=1 Tax=Physella acuta TaxID=109671 RepID=UPI0027DD1FE7|nr:ATPase family AAA domain-containing protein 2-like isoform X4 [Physella acuta]